MTVVAGWWGVLVVVDASTHAHRTSAWERTRNACAGATHGHLSPAYAHTSHFSLTIITHNTMFSIFRFIHCPQVIDPTMAWTLLHPMRVSYWNSWSVYSPPTVSFSFTSKQYILHFSITFLKYFIILDTCKGTHIHARKVTNIKFPHTGAYVELDIWIPTLNLSFEFQVLFLFITLILPVYFY